jgi:hypothetical protein
MRPPAPAITSRMSEVAVAIIASWAHLRSLPI